jgi:hypothetical protein
MKNEFNTFNFFYQLNINNNIIMLFPRWGWQLEHMHRMMLMRLVATLLPSFMLMQSINSAKMEVCLRCVGNLMSGLDRELICLSVGTRRMEAIISISRALSMIGMDHLLEVMHGFCSPLFTWVLWMVSSSLKKALFSCGSLSYFPYISWPSDNIPFFMPHERGSMKCSPTYYNFVTHQIWSSPSPSSSPPPHTIPFLTSLPSREFPYTVQNRDIVTPPTSHQPGMPLFICFT